MMSKVIIKTAESPTIIPMYILGVSFEQSYLPVDKNIGHDCDMTT